MTISTTKLEINDALCVALLDGPERMAIQLDRERAMAVGAALIEFAMRRPTDNTHMDQTMNIETSSVLSNLGRSSHGAL